MRKNRRGTILVFTMAMFIVLSCAGRQPQVEAVAVQGEKTIDLKASSYKFEPNNIKAKQGDTIVLNITNSSNTRHNFTIEDPGGKTLQSVELPPNKTEQVRVSLPEKGEYHFYCNKPFHPTLGMKGRIEAGPGS